MDLKSEVLQTLDNSNDGFYKHFVWLDNIYSYLIDCRMNIFKGPEHKWAIAIERVGFSPREGRISIEVYYYGNCLINLEKYNGSECNYYSIYVIDDENFNATVDLDLLVPEAEYWVINNKKVPLEHSSEKYIAAGIVLTEYEPGRIGVEEAARFIAAQDKSAFRATDEQLYKSIPLELKKILVLDEWNHKDFMMQYSEHSQVEDKYEWDNNRPSLYETWQMIAEVIDSGNVSRYNPTQAANTHWSYYPESGTF